MNADQPYARDTDRQQPEAAERSPLAVHGDPSLRQQATPEQQRPQHGVAWVRPSDLPTMIGNRIIGRGLDLKADLVRRANRPKPDQPKVPKERVTKTAIGAAEPPSITHQRRGGISL